MYWCINTTVFRIPFINKILLQHFVAFGYRDFNTTAHIKVKFCSITQHSKMHICTKQILFRFYGLEYIATSFLTFNFIFSGKQQHFISLFT